MRYRFKIQKPLLVGENNPYSADPRHALWPQPGGAAGARLCSILAGGDDAAYLERFDRTNLLAMNGWSAPAAQAAAETVLNRDPHQKLVLLGRKVADAFGVPFEPFRSFKRAGRLVAVLPHPSGLCRAWNDPDAPGYARAAVQALEAVPVPRVGAPEVASFFTGVGCFDLAFLKAGWNVSYACEWSDKPRRIYEARFGHAPQGCDINEVKPRDIPESARVWIGGFPCQDVSTTGKRAGVTASRTGLLWKLLELFDRSPRAEWIVLENVVGLVRGSNSREGSAEARPQVAWEVGSLEEDATWMGIVLGALADRGLWWSYRVLDTWDFGVPQSRPRVFIVARRPRTGGRSPGEVLFRPEAGTNPAAKQVVKEMDVTCCHCLTTWNPANQIAGYTVVTMVRDKGPEGRLRFLTPRECERLQGLPDDWTLIPGVKDRHRYHAIGNGGTVQVMEWIARGVREVIESEEQESAS